MASKYDADNSAFPKRLSASPPPRKKIPSKIFAADTSAQKPIHLAPQNGSAAHPKVSSSGSTYLPQPPDRLSNRRWLKRWPLMALVLFGIIGTVGTTAVVSLFRVPNLPNCRAIFWPTASASLRLQCAEAYADQGGVKNLLAAIALVDQLPKIIPSAQTSTVGLRTGPLRC